MTWRLAESLEVLRGEVQSISPGTEFGTIGDPAHQAEPSDHNPNAAGVVCALDVMAGHGLDLAAIAEQVRVSHHPDLKYVIYDRRIASRSSSFAWRPYDGSNPHTDHVHVSVGVGSDGKSRQPYDDTMPWGVAPVEDDMTPDEHNNLVATDARVYQALVLGKKVMDDTPGAGPDTPVYLPTKLEQIEAKVDAILVALAGGAPGGVPPHTHEQTGTTGPAQP